MGTTILTIAACVVLIGTAPAAQLYVLWPYLRQLDARRDDGQAADVGRQEAASVPVRRLAWLPRTPRPPDVAQTISGPRVIDRQRMIAAHVRAWYAEADMPVRLALRAKGWPEGGMMPGS